MQGVDLFVVAELVRAADALQFRVKWAKKLELHRRIQSKKTISYSSTR